MLTLHARPPFSLFTYKRRYQTLPRFYLKDETHFKHSRMLLTPRGLASATLAAIAGVGFFVTLSSLL